MSTRRDLLRTSASMMAVSVVGLASLSLAVRAQPAVPNMPSPNPFLATVGLRVEPRPQGAGNSFALEVDVGQMPASFYRAVEETVFETLKEGIFGWQVIDCHVAIKSAARRHSEAPGALAEADRGRFRRSVLGE